MNLSTSEIKTQSIKGIKWVGVAEIFTRILQVISAIILAKLLGPNVFGKFGICLILYRLVYTIGDFGFGTTIIQKKNIESVHINNIIVLCFAFSLLLTFTVYNFSNAIEIFFNFDDIAQPIRIFSLVFIPLSLTAILKSLYIRELRFKTLTIIEILSVLLNSIVSILLAFVGFGIWSLLIGLFVENIVLTVILFVFGNWFPTSHINFRHFKEIFNFRSQII